jgi:hypothetical protein
VESAILRESGRNVIAVPTKMMLTVFIYLADETSSRL